MEGNIGAIMKKILEVKAKTPKSERGDV